jgi:resolvase-like protein
MVVRSSQLCYHCIRHNLFESRHLSAVWKLIGRYWYLADLRAGLLASRFTCLPQVAPTPVSKTSLFDPPAGSPSCTPASYLFNYHRLFQKPFRNQRPNTCSLLKVLILCCHGKHLGGYCGRSLPMLVGYARVSTQEQSLALQHDASKQAGCERVFADTMCSAPLRDQWRQVDRAGARPTDRRPGVHVLW